MNRLTCSCTQRVVQSLLNLFKESKISAFLTQLIPSSFDLPKESDNKNRSFVLIVYGSILDGYGDIIFMQKMYKLLKEKLACRVFLVPEPPSRQHNTEETFKKFNLPYTPLENLKKILDKETSTILTIQGPCRSNKLSHGPALPFYSHFRLGLLEYSTPIYIHSLIDPPFTYASGLGPGEWGIFCEPLSKETQIASCTLPQVIREEIKQGERVYVAYAKNPHSLVEHMKIITYKERNQPRDIVMIAPGDHHFEKDGKKILDVVDKIQESYKFIVNCGITHIRFCYSADKKGTKEARLLRQDRIVNTKKCTLVFPGRLTPPEFAYISRISNTPVLTTGDQSVIESIFQKKPFIYEVLEHKKDFFKNLVKRAKHAGLNALSSFIHKAGIKKKTKLLPQEVESLCQDLEKPELLQEMEKFINHLNQECNLETNLLANIKQILGITENLLKEDPTIAKEFLVQKMTNSFKPQAISEKQSPI